MNRRQSYVPIPFNPTHCLGVWFFFIFLRNLKKIFIFFKDALILGL